MVAALSSRQNIALICFLAQFTYQHVQKIAFFHSPFMYQHVKTLFVVHNIFSAIFSLCELLPVNEAENQHRCAFHNDDKVGEGAGVYKV